MQDSSEDPHEKEIEAEKFILKTGLDVSGFRYEVCRLDALNFLPKNIALSIRKKYYQGKLQDLNGWFVAKYINDLKEATKSYFENGESFSRIHEKRKIPTVFLYKYFYSTNNEDEFGEGDNGKRYGDAQSIAWRTPHIGRSSAPLCLRRASIPSCCAGQAL